MIRTFVKGFVRGVVKSCQFPPPAVSLPAVRQFSPSHLARASRSPHYLRPETVASAFLLAPLLTFSLPLKSSRVMLYTGLIFLKYVSDHVILWLRSIL